MSGRHAAAEVICPGCSRRYPPSERFCAACGIPLVHLEGSDTAAQPDGRHERARKVKPQLTEGALIRVAGASNQAEAEFIQGLLLEEGVPSLLRRTAGFDVPDFLAAGPRDVLVPEAGVSAAREVLLEAELISASPPGSQSVAPARLLAGLVAALVLGALLVWLVFVLTQ